MLALAAPAQIVIGDWAARTVAEEQPMKLAAMEGLDKTTDGAGLTIGGIYVDGEVYGGVDDPEAALPARRTTTRTPRSRGSTPCRRTTARRWPGSATASS